MQLLLLLALAQLPRDSLPPPRGFVNDFAGVIDAAAAARMEATLREVQRLTRGDIAVVTLSDIGHREASDVALQIFRQWKLGGAGPVGDPSKDLGVVLLVVPLKDHKPGTGKVRIEVGKGAEGFLNDARVGRIADSMVPALRDEDYSSALETGAGLLAQAFANESHVTLTAPALAPVPQPAEPQSAPHIPGPIIAFVVFLIIIIVLSSIARAARGSGMGALWWLSVLSGMRGSGRGRWGGGGWGGGGWGGFGGGGGGGFGGFGGGGGASGGGAGRSF